MTFEEEMVGKIDSGEKLSEWELKNLVYNGNEVDIEYGEDRRWTRDMESIIKLGDRYFSIMWEQGLTECQENEFWNQPVEVEKKEYDKMIHVVEWVAKEDAGSDK